MDAKTKQTLPSNTYKGFFARHFIRIVAASFRIDLFIGRGGAEDLEDILAVLRQLGDR